MNRKEAVGKKFNRLLVVGWRRQTKRESGKDKNPTFLLCVCDCGVSKEISYATVVEGKTKSCGCYRDEVRPTQNVKHGQVKTPTYGSWASMRMRCLDLEYADYGGRGITFCDRWNDFENFLADMGPRPPGHTLERKDVNGNYEPGNCEWITKAAQSDNRRNTVRITRDGVTKTLKEWAIITGIPAKRIHDRIAKDWPNDLLFVPKNTTYRRQVVLTKP